jgi:SAM-dependent methyltransferase
LLNWAARYFPILRVLSNHAHDADPILEIGSGSFGLAHFHPGRVVGCDIMFPWPPKENMLPVCCSATQLPFANLSFDAVVASDMLEHVAPDSRALVIHETLRVARKLVIFGFPCGVQARALDEEFLAFHQKHSLRPPDWLVEHMSYPYPGEELFNGLGGGWKIVTFANERLGFHGWMNRREMSQVWNRFFDLCIRLAPKLVEVVLRYFDGEPCYRKILVLVRNPDTGAAQLCPQPNSVF